MNLNYLSCSKENNIRVNTSLLSFLLLSLRSVSLRKKARPVRESNNIEDNVRRISVKVSCRHKFQTVKPQITFRLRFPARTINPRIAFSEDLDPSIGSMDASDIWIAGKSHWFVTLFFQKNSWPIEQKHRHRFVYGIGEKTKERFRDVRKLEDEVER